MPLALRHGSSINNERSIKPSIPIQSNLVDSSCLTILIQQTNQTIHSISSICSISFSSTIKPKPPQKTKSKNQEISILLSQSLSQSLTNHSIMTNIKRETHQIERERDKQERHRESSLDQTMLSTPSSPVSSKHRINSSRLGRRDASHDTALLNIDACSEPSRSAEI